MPEIIYELVKDYSSRTKNPVMEFSSLLAYIKKNAEKFTKKNSAFAILNEAPETVLVAELENLAVNGTCSLTYDDVHIKTIYFSDFYISLIKQSYAAYKENNDLPFPNEDILGLSLPQELVTTINVREDFIKWLSYEEKSKEAILRLQFPEDFRTLVITSSLFFSDLLPLALSKIRVYLRVKRNLNYIQNKMIGLFPEKDRIALREMMDAVFDKPEHAASTMKNPTEFSFRFWASLANQIILEFKPKANKLADEICFAQAAYLVGFYNAFFKSKLQTSRDEEFALKHLELLLKKSPYFFSITDIYNFRDKKGVPLLKKYSKDKLHTYIKTKISRGEGDSLPELLHIKAAGNKEYFIQKDMYIPLTVKKAEDASLHYRKLYIDTWMEEMKQFRKPQESLSDRAFERDLEDRFGKEDPFLQTLLRFEILFLLKDEANLSYETAKEIARYFAKEEKALIPLSGILKLKREELLSYARSLLPVWQTIPVISGLIVFFKRLFSGKANKGSASSSKAKSGERLPDDLVGGDSIPGDSVARDSIARDAYKTFGSPEASDEESIGEGRQISGTGEGGGGRNTKTAKAQLVVYRETINSLKNHFVGEHKSLDVSVKELAEKWNPLYDPQARKNLGEDVNSMVRDFVRGLKRRLLAKPPDIESIRTMAERLSGNEAFAKIKKKELFRSYLEVYIIKLLSKV